jgi:hypothetical protein
MGNLNRIDFLENCGIISFDIKQADFGNKGGMG